MARVHWTAASQFARDLVNIQQSILEEGVENVGKRTPSDPMETACRGKSPSDCRESVRETLIQQRIYSKVKLRRGSKMSANGLHRIRRRRFAVARVNRTAASQFARDLVNIKQSIVEEGLENVGKRTSSDAMETGCCGKNPSDSRELVHETLMDTGCRDKS